MHPVHLIYYFHPYYDYLGRMGIDMSFEQLQSFILCDNIASHERFSGWSILASELMAFNFFKLFSESNRESAKQKAGL